MSLPWRVAVIVAAVVGSIFLMAYPASAHLFQKDGDVKVVIHVDPDHQPVAGERSAIFFYLQGQSGAFDPASYKGTITIELDGRRLSRFDVLGAESKGVAAVPDYVFEEAGTYRVVLKAQPTRRGIPPFTFSFDQPVSGAGEAASGNNRWAYLALGGSIVIWLLIAVIDRFLPTRTDEDENRMKGKL